MGCGPALCPRSRSLTKVQQLIMAVRAQGGALAVACWRWRSQAAAQGTSAGSCSSCHPTSSR